MPPLSYDILEQLDALDRERVPTIDIDPVSHELTYHNNAPKTTHECVRASPSVPIFTVPMSGDLLLALKIDGHFSRASFYQYSEDGKTKIIYDEWTASDASIWRVPFPTAGVPLLQVAKAFYVEIENPHEDTRVLAQFAHLPITARRLITLKHECGVRVRHRSGDMYHAAGYYEYGFASNCLKKLA